MPQTQYTSAIAAFFYLKSVKNGSIAPFIETVNMFCKTSLSSKKQARRFHEPEWLAWAACFC